MVGVIWLSDMQRMSNDGSGREVKGKIQNTTELWRDFSDVPVPTLSTQMGAWSLSSTCRRFTILLPPNVKKG